MVDESEFQEKRKYSVIWSSCPSWDGIADENELESRLKYSVIWSS